jgi:hypothetical protein
MLDNRENKGLVGDNQFRFESFTKSFFTKVPDNLVTIYSDPLLLNFQIVEWYKRELCYILAFRLLFAFLFYSVPLLIAVSVIALDLLDSQTAAVLELVLVSYYTAPVLSRLNSEMKLTPQISKTNILLINLDVPMMIFLYLVSSVTSAVKDTVASFLTGLTWAIPSTLIFAYCYYKGYTVYTFGFADRYTTISPFLLFDAGVAPTNFRGRLFAPMLEAKEFVENSVKQMAATVNTKNASPTLISTPPAQPREVEIVVRDTAIEDLDTEDNI